VRYTQTAFACAQKSLFGEKNPKFLENLDVTRARLQPKTSYLLHIPQHLTRAQEPFQKLVSFALVIRKTTLKSEPMTTLALPKHRNRPAIIRFVFRNLNGFQPNN